MNGVVGGILDWSTHTSRTTELSEFKVVELLSKQKQPGISVLIWVFVLFVMILPALRMLLLLVLWICPMGPKMHGWVYACVHALNAWQYLEVYLASLLVGVSALGVVTITLCSPNDHSQMCNWLHYGLRLLVEAGMCAPTDQVLFGLTPDILPGFILLFTAAIMLHVTTAALNAAAVAAEIDYAGSYKGRRHRGSMFEILMRAMLAIGAADMEELPMPQVMFAKSGYEGGAEYKDNMFTGLESCEGDPYEGDSNQYDTFVEQKSW
jgi:hypothetical protein